MKTITISVRDEDYSKLRMDLGKLDYLEMSDSHDFDIITLVSQDSLAQDWLSEEDSRYDELPSK